MALFTDGQISSIEDLTLLDSELLAVASVEGIDVTQKLALAQKQLGLEIESMLLDLRTEGGSPWLTPRPDLGHVAVTPGLQQWHACRTLEMVYADGYNSQLNDRYAGKRDQFHELARWSREKLMDIGIGIVQMPIAQADTPTVTCVPGGLPDGSYYVAITWVNTAGQEGAPSPVAVVVAADSSLLVSPGAAPRNATGWNVYAGADPNAMHMQNTEPLACSATWLQPGILSAGGRAPGSGQRPTYMKPLPRVCQRG